MFQKFKDAPHTHIHHTQPAYHSHFNDAECRMIGDIPLLPIKSEIRGPAPSGSEKDKDIIDEAIHYFRANVLFKNFEILGDADRLLVYLTLCIQEIIVKLHSSKSKAEAEKRHRKMLHDKFIIPGDAKFPLKNFFQAPKSSGDADKLRSYLKQLRAELFQRMMVILYAADGTRNKWWFGFYKKEFMGKKL